MAPRSPGGNLGANLFSLFPKCLKVAVYRKHLVQLETIRFEQESNVVELCHSEIGSEVGNGQVR
jgi:hypothetical protein